LREAQNPLVFIDISINGINANKVIIELFEDTVPKTVKNFMAFIQGKPHSGYLGSLFHRIIPGFMIQGGDFERGDGSGGWSIYGKTFKDENFELEHNEAGLLSMANSGPDTNGSQFFITLDQTQWLNKKHVVFGKVIKGMNIIRVIESYGTEDGTPTATIRINKCGIINT